MAPCQTHKRSETHTRKAEGTGIGLALTKELVQLMDGSITVKSPPVGAKKGTEFTVNLPIEILTEYSEVAGHNTIKQQLITTPGHPSQQEQGNYTIAENNGKALILLVEDNADVVAYTASCLQDYRLAVGKDGKEGCDIACDIVPDIIITDVMMPFMDGFEMTKKLRQDERTSHIPIIMLTAKADIESKLEGLEHGADAYLEKPFYKEELLLRVKKLLEQRKKLQQYYSKQIGIAEDNDIITNQETETITEQKTEHEFVKKVREIVEANFTNYEFTVEQLCKLVFMSHSQLHRKLDALTGCSPNKFIRIIRLNKAKELLKKPNESIASIALECGYNDPGYFARVFKQEFGVTPQEWRAGN
jgi:YesN/AraC family two-component response regulator